MASDVSGQDRDRWVREWRVKLRDIAPSTEWEQIDALLALAITRPWASMVPSDVVISADVAARWIWDRLVDGHTPQEIRDHLMRHMLTSEGKHDGRDRS